MQIAILANPYSGRGSGPAKAAAIAEALQRRGHRTVIRVGQERQDALAWAQEASIEADRLVVVGGDGSLSAVADGLPPNAPPLALCPMGTSDLMARELRLPRRVEAVANVVERGRVQQVDTGRVNGRRACLLWGFGLDGELMRMMEERRQGPIRKVEYLPLLWSMMRDWAPKPQRVVADGEDLGEFDFGFVSGGRTYASWRIRLGPSAYDDGWWELYAFRRVQVPNGTLYAAAALMGQLHRSPGVTWRRVRSVRVEGLEPTPVQIDGDYFGTTPVTFEVSDFRLPLLVPAG
ncbi:MAG: hypothetical protein EYC70_11645 [Planctomycetota bacterium]|nr:MAG: hypothetical protein EYC70_11645 [Planctomycetota bacterium]